MESFDFQNILTNFRYFKKLYYAIAMVVLVLVVGIVGYYTIEDYTFLDSVFMTVITVATVGYREVKELDDAGKIFTSILIIFSIGTFAYAVSVITRYIIEGEFQTYFRHYRVNKEIQKLKNHVIVCGFGRNGRQACEQLRSGDEKFVAIEAKPELVAKMREEDNILFIEGDATKDEVLIQAGIDSAKALITALPSDAANVFVVLTARDRNPKLKIISRASEDGSEHKLKRAGADNVIMPDKIGGTHMAALVTKPDVLEFIDHITGRINIRLEEIHFSSLPENMRNKSIRDLEIRNKTGANIIGFKTADGDYVINPPPETIMMPDAKLFVLGTQEQVMRFKEILINN
ncbi:MAG: potassium channel protein [Bacteroidetes bacterium]|nr:potassium channel protein [Bacteroidota bacterium]MBL0066335.1 potassium channel protein [Bacteroidota bacterium]MBL0139013.1 potassium channel protein [Bacteroidota bacterium]